MIIQLGLPQLIYLILLGIAVVQGIINHGKPRGNGNVWDTLLGGTIMLAVLYWGGFFNGG